jgi:hypothetical protein
MGVAGLSLNELSLQILLPLLYGQLGLNQVCICNFFLGWVGGDGLSGIPGGRQIHI